MNNSISVPKPANLTNSPQSGRQIPSPPHFLWGRDPHPCPLPRCGRGSEASSHFLFSGDGNRALRFFVKLIEEALARQLLDDRIVLESFHWNALFTHELQNRLHSLGFGSRYAIQIGY